MDRRRATVTACAVLVAVAGAVGGTGVATAAGTVQVGFGTDAAELAAGESHTYLVTVDAASEGVGSFELDVSLDDTDVARVDAVSVVGDPAYVETSVADGGANASAIGLNRTGPGVDLVRITVVGESAGSATLDLGVTSVGTREGESYDPELANGTADVTVESTTPTPTATPTSTPGGGGPGAGGGGGGSVPAGTDVAIAPWADGVEMRVDGARAGDELAASFDRVGVRSDRLAVRRLGVAMVFADDDFSVYVNEPTRTPANASAAPVGTVLGYFTTRPSGVASTAIERVSVRFSVPSAAMPPGTDREDVVALAFRDGSWTRLETTHRGNGTYRVTAAGFATFAVGVTGATGTTPPPTTTAAADTSTTAADTTTAAAGDTTTAVADPEDGPPSTAVEEPGGLGIEVPGFGPVVAVLAVVVAAGLLGWRRD